MSNCSCLPHGPVMPGVELIRIDIHANASTFLHRRVAWILCVHDSSIERDEPSFQPMQVLFRTQLCAEAVHEPSDSTRTHRQLRDHRQRSHGIEFEIVKDPPSNEPTQLVHLPRRVDSDIPTNTCPSVSSDIPRKNYVLLPTSQDAFGLSSPLSRSEEHTSELQSRQYLVCR